MSGYKFGELANIQVALSTLREFNQYVRFPISDTLLDSPILSKYFSTPLDSPDEKEIEIIVSIAAAKAVFDRSNIQDYSGKEELATEIARDVRDAMRFAKLEYVAQTTNLSHQEYVRRKRSIPLVKRIAWLKIIKERVALYAIKSVAVAIAGTPGGNIVLGTYFIWKLFPQEVKDNLLSRTRDTTRKAVTIIKNCCNHIKSRKMGEIIVSYMKEIIPLQEKLKSNSTCILDEKTNHNKYKQDPHEKGIPESANQRRKVETEYKIGMKKEFQNQLTTALLSAPIVFIPHFHYKLVDDTLEKILCPREEHKIFDLSLEKNVIEYDCGRKCIVKFKTKDFDNDSADYECEDVKSLLKIIVEQNEFSQPVILLLKNFSAYLNDSDVQSLLASFAYQYEKGEIDEASTIIIVSPMDAASLPKEIEKFITVVEIKAPHQEEIMEFLDKYEISKRNLGNKEEVLKDLCRTLQGLQLYEIQQILNSALVRTGKRISTRTIQIALEEKKNIVRKSGIIEVVDANESFEQIGGLEILKEDLRRKAKIFRHLSEAQENKVTLPKGVLILGMPGCGKTMIAKAVANEFGVSLLRLDVNRLMGKYVGESETNLRNALTTAEAAHPCVLWIDEIEKAFAGANGRNDNMLVMRLMGHFLTWMQERTTPVFIVATANDVMRPEFMRKGRFDEVYFVDFPDDEERKEILQKAIKPYDNMEKKGIFDFSELGEISDLAVSMKVGSDGFSGAEIKSVVNMVIERKFEEYINRKQNQPKNNAPLKIMQKDFMDVIESIKDSVMANQVSKRDSSARQGEKTNIERIRDMQNLYKFKPAKRGKLE